MRRRAMRGVAASPTPQKAPRTPRRGSSAKDARFDGDTTPRRHTEGGATPSAAAKEGAELSERARKLWKELQDREADTGGANAAAKPSRVHPKGARSGASDVAHDKSMATPGKSSRMRPRDDDVDMQDAPVAPSPRRSKQRADRAQQAARPPWASVLDEDKAIAAAAPDAERAPRLRSALKAAVADHGKAVSRASALEEECHIQQTLLRSALKRQADLTAQLQRARREQSAAAADATSSRAAATEAEKACRSARHALSECAAQNAKLVAAYAEKKKEVRELSSEVERRDASKASETQSTQDELAVLRAELEASKAEAEGLRERAIRAEVRLEKAEVAAATAATQRPTPVPAAPEPVRPAPEAPSASTAESGSEAQHTAPMAEPTVSDHGSAGASPSISSGSNRNSSSSEEEAHWAEEKARWAAEKERWAAEKQRWMNELESTRQTIRGGAPAPGTSGSQAPGAGAPPAEGKHARRQSLSSGGSSCASTDIEGAESQPARGMADGARAHQAHLDREDASAPPPVVHSTSAPAVAQAAERSGSAVPRASANTPSAAAHRTPGKATPQCASTAPSHKPKQQVKPSPGHRSREAFVAEKAREVEQERKQEAEKQAQAQAQRAAAATAAAETAKKEKEASTASNTQQAQQYKASGNASYQKGKYKEAYDEYTKGINLKCGDKSFEAILHCNRAAALMAQKQYVHAAADCDAALALDPCYSRALQRRVDVWTAMGDYQQAVRDLQALIGPPHRLGAEATTKLADAQRRARTSKGADPYVVLNVETTAKDSEVKSAYRKLALRFHPDKCRDEALRPQAEVLFKLVSGAYNTLSDPASRRKHDQQAFANMAREARNNYAAATGHARSTYGGYGRAGASAYSHFGGATYARARSSSFAV